MKNINQEDLLAGLNSAQRNAVAAPDSSHMILAGAGSGKTRVLTRRIAWLNREYHVPTHSILAVTFTNKAAAEMKERVINILGCGKGIWIGTFHSIAHRILRTHPEDAGLTPEFQVIDAEDQARMVKKTAKECGVDLEEIPLRSIVTWINSQKDEGLEPNQVNARTSHEKIMLDVYQQYQSQCVKAHLVDFGELLLRTRNLFRDVEKLRDYYQGRFSHLLVDEFQDTNLIQYDLVRLWAGNVGKVFAVGDVDQCLVRGTRIRMANGQEQPIEAIKPGNRVFGRDGKKEGHRVIETRQVWHEGVIVSIVTHTGQRLSSTADHTHLIERHPDSLMTQGLSEMDLVLCGASTPENTAHRAHFRMNDEKDQELLVAMGKVIEQTSDGVIHAQAEFTDFNEAWMEARRFLANGGRLSLSASLCGVQEQREKLWLVPASKIIVGDRMMTQDGTWASVTDIVHESHAGVVYDLEVEHAHHYIAEGVVTHNCIYGWRGSRAENIQKFLNEFPDASLLRLEQNYRSTQTILEAANEVIKKNPGRIEKNLWTDGGKGEPITLYTAVNEQDEASYVTRRIQSCLSAGMKANDCAILYRSNAQSRAFEEMLITAKLPYRITGGLRFFERAEIKDAMAYLRLVAARQDDAAFERIINVPTRGLGEKSIDQIRKQAKNDASSLWEASLSLLSQGGLGAKAAESLKRFMTDIEQWGRDRKLLTLPEAVTLIIEGAGLRAFHTRESKREGANDSESRGQNLDELVSVAARFIVPEEDQASGMDPWFSFLTHSTLEAGEKKSKEGPCVELMTLHAAKGLEFPCVFLVGLEESLLPSAISISEDRLDEERRLCYVGITRAMKHLTLTHARERRLYGQWVKNPLCRFVKDIPHALLQKEHAGQTSQTVRFGDIRTPSTLGLPANRSLRRGDLVSHASWGRGVVTRLKEESQNKQQIQAAFQRHGLKWVDENTIHR